MNTSTLLSALESNFKLNAIDSRLLIVGLGITGYSAARFYKIPL